MLFLDEDGVVLGLLSCLCLCQDYVFLHNLIFDPCADEEGLQALLERSLVLLGRCREGLSLIWDVKIDGRVIYEVNAVDLVDLLHLGFKSDWL